MAEAAEALGITAEAVRTRIKRGKLDSVKEPPDRTGTVYVLLPVDPTGPNNDPTPQGQDQTDDQTPSPGLLEAKDETISELRARVESLERQLDARQEEIRRRDILLANFVVERVPQLEAPQERPQAPETAASGPEGAEPRPADTGAQGGAEPPLSSWWRRWFGG